MVKDNKTLHIYIGRFQPLHIGHEAVIREMINNCGPNDRILILIGSAETINSKNPFTGWERFSFLYNTFLRDRSVQERKKIIIESLKDFETDKEWVSYVKDIVNVFRVSNRVLYGAHRDSSCYYLDLFPEYQYIEVPEYIPGLSATKIRQSILDNTNYWKEHTNEYVREFISKNYESILENLKREIKWKIKF